MKELYIVVCNSGLDKYCYISESKGWETFENAYKITGNNELELYTNILEICKSNNVDTPENLGDYFKDYFELLDDKSIIKAIPTHNFLDSLIYDWKNLPNFKLICIIWIISVIIFIIMNVQLL